jgi:predicted MFS family arabinose efflux permease
MGAIYGLNQSAFSGGQAGGAALAAVVATLWGLQSTYLFAAALIALTAAWWLVRRRISQPVPRVLQD